MCPFTDFLEIELGVFFGQVKPNLLQLFVGLFVQRFIPLDTSLEVANPVTYAITEVSVASSARKKTVKSPMGEALMKLPPMVAMLRMGVDEISVVY